MKKEESVIPTDLANNLNEQKDNITNLSGDIPEENLKKAKIHEQKVSKIVAFLSSIKVPFVVSVSNYTCKIKSNLYNIHFLKKAQSIQMFQAYRKIKTDLKSLPKKVDMNFIRYYQTGFMYDNLHCDYIYQIDIKSCYATILKNYGLVSSETFKYLQGIKKENRLASIGMLASRKNVFEFGEDGRIIKDYPVVNEDSDYFFFCVQETYKIMNECKLLLGESFLFSWVDAIYFIGNESRALDVMQFLAEKFNLNSTCDILFNFRVKSKDGYWHCRYIKKGKPTFINISFLEQPEKKEIFNYLQTLKFKQNENNDNKIRRKIC